MVTLPARRTDDTTFRMLVASSPDCRGRDGALPGATATLRELEFGIGTRRPVPTTTPAPSGREVIVIPLAGEALVVAGGETVRIRGGPGEALLERAAAFALAAHQRALDSARHREARTTLLAVAEKLNRVRTRSDVFETLIEHARDIVGGYAPFILERIRSAAGHRAGMLRITARVRPSFAPTIRLRPFEPLTGPCVVQRTDVLQGSPFAQLRPVFEAERLTSISFIPMGTKALLAMMERRETRELDVVDWFHFGSLVRFAHAALVRIGDEHFHA
jgi:hypothetical protein